MNNNFNEIPLIRQSIFTAHLDGVNHQRIAQDVENFGLPVGGDCEEYGYISRGFVQHEDIICPATKEFANLESSVLNVVNTITNNEYKIDEMWAVNLKHNQSVIAHSHYKNTHMHPSEYYSVAYYPTAPAGSAELIFSADWCGYMHETIAIKPEDGLLIVFNSFITHMTARQMINSPRIVVSMNLSPVTPRATPNADWSIYANRPVIESSVSPKSD